MISFMPEVRGGGAKDEKFREAQSNLAHLLLDKGFALSQTTAAVDRLLAQAGVARVQRALDLTDGVHRWSQVQKLCDQFSVTLPEQASRATRPPDNCSRKPCVVTTAPALNPRPLTSC